MSGSIPTSADAAAAPVSTAARRAHLRARLHLRSVLGLLPVVLEGRPLLRDLFAWTRATVTFEVEGEPELAARIMFARGTVTVAPGASPGAALRFRFPDAGAANAFFSGKSGLPRIEGIFSSPFLLVRVLALLASLRILEPGPRPVELEERALRVRLLLFLVTDALAELVRGGHEAASALAADSPDRVWQWTVEGGPSAWLRLSAGRAKAGRGTYPHRRPFVHYVFRDVDAAHEVFTATASQMLAVQRGWIRTDGSPEYSRKIGLLMQEVDRLLVEG